MTERLLALRLLASNFVEYPRRSAELWLEDHYPTAAGRGQTLEPMAEMMMVQGLNSPS